MARAHPAAALPQNTLDKIIAYVAPGMAAKRMVQRGALALAGGYTGARIDRATLARYLPTSGSADAEIIRDLPMLRARSSDQMRNAPVAVGALNQAVSGTVGTGLSHSARIDALFLGLSDEQAEAWQRDTDRRYLAWSESTDCDLARKLDIYGLQELFMRSALERGDCFAITPRVARPGKDPVLAVQLVEADRVCNPEHKPNTDTLVDGIELDADTREPLACHIARRHPGDGAQGQAWTRVAFRGRETGRRNVLHGHTMLRPGQTRGVPWIAPILEPLKQLQRWTDAELNAAVISGLFSVFIKMDPGAFQDIFDEDAQGAIVRQASQWSGEMESGKAVNLLPGESIESGPPGRPNPEFDPFWNAMVRQIGMALGMPHEVLTMHFQSSYSAARGAMLMAAKFFRYWRDWIAKTFCQPLYELWLLDEVAAGRISAPGIFSDDVVRAAWCAGVWTGDGAGSIDPGKDIAAARDRVALGVSTLEAESILHDGAGWEAKHRQRVKEIAAQKADGIWAPLPSAAAPVQAPQPAKEDD